MVVIYLFMPERIPCFNFIFILCGWLICFMCILFYVYVCGSQASQWRPEEDTTLPGTGVADGCEFHVGVGKSTQVLWKSI